MSTANNLATTNNDTTGKQPDSMPSSRLRSVLAYAGALATAAVTSIFSIQRRFHSHIFELKTSREFQKENPGVEMPYQRKRRYQEEVGGLMAKGKPEELLAKKNELQKDFNKDIEEFSKANHLGRIDQKFRFLKTHQKQEVAFGAIAVFTVAVGVALSIAQSKHLSHLFGHDNERSPGG